ncbi:GMP synthase family protein [Hoeflea sp. IMCC20628]|uniref:type 1 glutamine amidotransferase n=1 Tax=Hoeflea sp. IMCC20628 TaxID=1620421 RepID=UPI00063BF463|nr:type 1 glutamine amidotransferase [Hoeflea sp. IMCC20628]AKH98963.1 GMP synthase family protein [Hoeflea sp. IMCC20628]
MRILIIQHSDKEHAGGFRPLFARDGHEISACIAPDEIGDVDLSHFDGLWVLGGPMQVWQADELPWLAREIEVIRDAVLVRSMPCFGICLGHQLLAHVLGGSVSQAHQSEVGLLHVEKSGEVAMFSGLSGPLPCFQWHSAEVSRLPEGAGILARSEQCAVQAMSWGQTVSSVQFHAEIDAATLADWYEIDGCEEMLRQEIGSSADHVFGKLTAAEADLTRIRASLYRHWLAGFTR